MIANCFVKLYDIKTHMEFINSVPDVSAVSLTSLVNNAPHSNPVNATKRKRGNNNDKLVDSSNSSDESDSDEIESFDEIDLDSDFEEDSSNTSDESYSDKKEDSSNTSDESYSDKKKNYRIAKKKKNPKNSKSKVFRSDETDSDESYSDKKKNNRSAKMKKKAKFSKPKVDSSNSSDSDEKTDGMTAYEKMIEKNRAEKMAFLQSLNIDEAKASLSDLLRTVKKRKPRVIREKSPIVPRLKSERVKDSTINYNEKILYEKVKEENEKLELQLLNHIPHKLSFEKAADSKRMYRDFQKYITIRESTSKREEISYDKSVLENLTVKKHIRVDHFLKALSWYPSVDHQIIATGNCVGNIGICNVNSNSNFHWFNVHNKGISHLQFNPFNPVEIFSSSYEGTLRCGDMVREMFSEVLNLSNKYPNYFDFLTSATYIVGQGNGTISIVDKRSRRKYHEEDHSCHNSSIRTVNVHPVDKHIFVSAGKKGSVRLWDLRKFLDPVVSLPQNMFKPVHSAFFSSVTGNSLLTMSSGLIRIYDSTNLTSIPLVKEQLLLKALAKGPTKASWLANSDEMFVAVGGDSSGIQIYDKQLNICHTLPSPGHSRSTTFYNHVGHPFVPAFAVSNNSSALVFT